MSATMNCQERHESGHEASPCGYAGVIGAGIAGLAASIALRRAGWDVEVFERSQFKNEVGAAITMTPNAALVLSRWGFDMEKAMAMPNRSLVIRSATDPSVTLQRQDFADGDGVLKNGVWLFHRVDLHSELRNLATAPPTDVIPAAPAQIKLGYKVEGLDCESGVIRLANGQTIHKDLIVVADGAHSQLISEVAGHPCEARRNGRSIYRWLVPMDIVMADPELGSVYSSEHSGFVAWLDPSTRAFWVSYVCRGGKVLNIALVHDTQPDRDEDGVWHSQVPREEVLSVAQNFHQSIKRMIFMPTEDGIHVHHAKTRPPLDSFARARTVVVGDAAHVMMPSHAAGAGIAIESAASLEVLFREVDGKDGPTVRYRLRLFDKLRIPRCNLTMLVSNSPQGQPRKSGVVDEIRKFYQGPLPPSDALPYSKAWRDVLFGHDEFRAAEKLLGDEGVEVKT